jgi:hypothetical protein
MKTARGNKNPVAPRSPAPKNASYKELPDFFDRYDGIDLRGAKHHGT